MRRALYALITGAELVTDVVPAWYDRGAVPDKPVLPYGVIGWQPDTSKPGGQFTQNVQVWIHDSRGDYNRIKDALRAVRALLESTLHYNGMDGTIVQADYRGCSGDQVDPNTNTNTMYHQFEIVGRDT